MSYDDVFIEQVRRIYFVFVSRTHKTVNKLTNGKRSYVIKKSSAIENINRINFSNVKFRRSSMALRSLLLYKDVILFKLKIVY